VGKDSYIFFTLRGGKRLQHAMDFEEIVSDFATDFFGVQEEDPVMSGKWYGVDEEMIVACHEWPSLLSVLVSMR